MTSAVLLPPAAAAYLASVRAQLTDLSAEEQDDLLADVEVSLLESSAEDEIAPELRFGTPVEFAAELRAAAGLAPAPTPAQVAPPKAVRSLAELVDELRNHRYVRAFGARAAELAPAWWLVRAYVFAGAIITLGIHGGWAIDHPQLPRLATPMSSGLLLALVIVVGSLVAGLALRRAPRNARLAGYALDLVLLVLLIPVVHDAWNNTPPTRTTFVSVSAPQRDGLARNGIPVKNIYPFDRAGRLLHDVRLYDQVGRALNVGSSNEANRRAVQTTAGKTAENAFPIRYVDPGTGEVSHPNAGPRLNIPSVTTPRLRANGSPARTGKVFNAGGGTD